MRKEKTSIYEIMGGEQSVRSLSHRFYELMDTLEEAKEIRAMHPESLEESVEKFFKFLSGWFGGPQLYIQKHGHPKLRMRHFPFSIDTNARDAWMLCMRIALAEHIPKKDIRIQIEEAFSNMAKHMQNRANK